MTDHAASADAIRVIDFDLEVDVVRTLRPLRMTSSDPTSRSHGDTFWKATRTSAGPATVAIRPSGPRQVTAWAWGPGSDEALAPCHRWLGLDDDLESFDPSAHPVVERLARDRAGVRMGTFGDTFDRLVPTIFGQVVIGKEAARSHRRLVYRFGEPAPGPEELRLSPTPDVIRELGSHHFHQLGVERRRAAVVQRAAKRAERIDALVDKPLDEAYRFLRSIEGIGPWTITSLGRFAFGDADAVIVGDYNLPHTVAWALAGKRRSNDEEMLELLEPFVGHRGRVQGMLKGNGKPPRHGPKLAFRNIERH